jgi:hypothetical protein
MRPVGGRCRKISIVVCSFTVFLLLFSPLLSDAGPECLLFLPSCVNTGQVTNQLFFQTSIDKMGEKLDELGAKYTNIWNGILDKKLSMLDEISQKRLGELNQMLEKQILNLDALADAKIAKLETTLQNTAADTLRELDIVIKDNLVEAESSANEAYGRLRGGADSFTLGLVKGLVKAATFFGIVLFAVATYVVFFLQKQSRRRAAIAVICSGVICVIIVVSGELLARSEARKQIAPIRQAFDEASRVGNLSLGLRLAARLAEMELDEPTHEFNVSKIEVLRKLYLQPNTFRTNEGRKAFISLTGKALSRGFKLSGQLDPELSVILAEVLATYGENRYAQYVAAVLSYRVLQSSPNRELYFQVDGRETATYLLRAYLQFPMANIEVAKAFEQGIGASIGADVNIPVVTLEELLSMSTHLGGDQNLSAKHALYLKVRGLSIQAHLAYSAVLAAIVDPTSSVVGLYKVPSRDQEWAYSQAKHVLSRWEELFESSEYRAATEFDRLVLLRAPFAVLDRLEDYKLGFSWVAPRGYSYTCSSNLPTMNRGFYLRKLFMVNKRMNLNPLERILSRLLRDKVITPNYAASALAEKELALNKEVGDLLVGLEDGMLFTLAHKDWKVGICESQGGRLKEQEPIDEVGSQFIKSAAPLLQVLERVASDAIVWCSQPLPFCFDPYQRSSQHTFIESISAISKEAGYSLTNEVEKAEGLLAQTEVAAIY